MESVVLEERINIEKAAYLLETLSFKDFYKTWNGTKKEGQIQYEKMVKYLSNKTRVKNNIVKYNYANGKTCGRLFGDDTIQSLVKNIRGFICDGVSTDIDMVNCHPVILLALCEEHNIYASYLENYVYEREKCISDIRNNDCVTSDVAKKKILTATNSNTYMRSKSSFLTNYDKEMKRIQKEFLLIHEYRYVKEFVNNTDNFQGSFINHVLCIHENEILKCMRAFCDDKKIEIQALMFDGLMVYGDINEFTLSEIENYIHTNSMFKKIKLKIKKHEYNLVMPDDYVVKNLVLDYDSAKKQFELENCKVGAEFVNEKGNNIIIYKITDFTTLHMEKIYEKEITDRYGKIIIEEKMFMTDWYLDGNKRRYDKYDCIPKDELCPSNVYNMWVKFPVELIDELTPNNKLDKALNWFLKHIEVLTDYNKEHYNFVLLWLSQMFQYPEHKSIHLIFVGEEGSGKGTLVSFLQKIMGGSGRCFQTSNPQEDVFGKFNDPMKEAFLVILNEADKSGGYNNNSKMKDMITDPTIVIRPKGKTSFTMKSCHRFMSFSNNPDPNIKNKRRDFTMMTSSDKVNDNEYFKEGYSYSDDIVCCKYIYDYLMKYPTLSKINNSDIPFGIYDEMLKNAQKDPITECIEEMCAFNYDTMGIVDYTANQLYEIYLDYAKRNFIEYKLNKIQFTTRLSYKKFNGITKKVKKIENQACNIYMFNFQILKNNPYVCEYEPLVCE